MISSIGTNNIELLLESYRTLEERPIKRLEQQRDSIDKRVSLFSTLKSKLRKLESLAKELSYTDSTSIFASKKATVSDTSYLSVTTDSTAVTTTHTISISQLAKADQIVSNQYTLSDTSIYTSLGAGTQTFQVTVNGQSYQISIEIQDNDDNEAILNKIVTAVNNTDDIAISASVIKDTETTGRLVFISSETGSTYKMSLSDVTGSLLSTIGMDDSTEMNGTSGGYVYTSSELDSIITVDGITITRSSNIIEDAIEGVTLTLKKTHQSGEVPVTLNITNNVENIKSKIQEFIDAYNDVISFINTNTKVDSTTYKRSALSGDFAITNLKLQLRNLISEPVTGLTSGDPNILATIGITTDREGKLSISDSDTLEDYLESNLDKVAALFNSTDGISSRLVSFLDDYTDGEGIIEKRKDVLQSQIQFINNRISSLEKTVDRKIEYYRQQFSRLQAAYASLSAQFGYMGNIIQSGFIQ